MDIIVNGKIVSLDSGNSLMELLRNMEIERLEGLALAVNQNIVPKVNWDTHELRDNDQVLLIEAAKGG